MPFPTPGASIARTGRASAAEPPNASGHCAPTTRTTSPQRWPTGRSSDDAGSDYMSPPRLQPGGGTGAGLSARQPASRFYIGTPCWWYRRKSGGGTGSTVPAPPQGQRCFPVCAPPLPPRRLARKPERASAGGWPRPVTDARHKRPDGRGQDSLAAGRDPERAAMGRKERRAVRPADSRRSHATDRRDRPAGEQTIRRSGHSSVRRPSGQDLRAWAAAAAAALPPLTEPQVAAVARLAAHLDADGSQEAAA